MCFLFEHLLIDRVGPYPKSKAGSLYLLAVICQSNRYPAAYPLQNITAKSVVKALSQFVSVFGIPKVIQTDRGTNFTSQLFGEVLKRLHVKHATSSACHLQSQGALERFHQTLKSLLRSYCTESNHDWEEARLLLAAREVVQSSTGFNPIDLVFGHNVRGPLAVLQEDWELPDPPVNLLDYVNGFKRRLTAAVRLGRGKFEVTQKKMKRQYDRPTEMPIFSPGDQVLALLSLVTAPFQAKFLGP